MGRLALLILSAIQDESRLDNGRIQALFSRGRLVRLADFEIESVEFDIDTTLGRCRAPDARRVERGETTRYLFEGLEVSVRYLLPAGAAFLRKEVSVRSLGGAPFGVREARLLDLRIPSIEGRVHRSYHCYFYFGSSERGGVLGGIESPFAPGRAEGDRMSASYSPGLKVPRGATFECEPAFLGVYSLQGRPREEAEREAMTEAISIELGPPRRRTFWQCFNGWSANAFRKDLGDPEWPRHRRHVTDMFRSAAEAGAEYWTSAATWGGDYRRVQETYVESEERRALREEMARHGVAFAYWFSPNNHNPWMNQNRYRPDRPEWTLHREPGKPDARGNCCGCPEFMEWLARIAIEDIRRTGAKIFGTDGDFQGGGGAHGGRIGYPVVCHATDHAHLTADASFACWKGILDLYKRIRREFPDILMTTWRPNQDLGAWGWRHVDAVSTIDEFPRPRKIAGSLSVGVGLGEDTRIRARTRRRRDCCPCWLDSAMLYPIQYVGNPAAEVWDRFGHEYGLLSAMAVCDSVNAITLPPRDRLVAADLEPLRRWADWARSHSEGFGPVQELGLAEVDGYARLREGRGYAFLFNPGLSSRTARLPWPAEHAGRRFPAGGLVAVPPHSAMVLRVEPDDGKPALFGVIGKLRIEGATAHVEGVEGPEGETVEARIRPDSFERVRINGRPMKFRREKGEIVLSFSFDGDRFSPELDWRRIEGGFEARFLLPSWARGALAAQKGAEKSASQFDRFPWADPSRLVLSIALGDFGRKDEHPQVTLNGRPIRTYSTPRDLAPGLYADLTLDAAFGGSNVLRVESTAVTGGMLFHLRPRHTRLLSGEY
jgi:hypothetical protein